MRRGRRWAGLVLVACASLARPAAAETPEELLSRGNTAYEQGQYEAAAEAYRNVLRYGVKDPIAEYNLGNAEFRLGNLGQAVLHYERARRMSPLDPDIETNLAFARAACFDQVETPPRAALLGIVEGLQDRLGPDRQAWLVLALFWLVAALVALGLVRPGAWSAWHGWLLAVLLAAGTLCAISWAMTLDRLEGSRSAVVLEPVVEVRAGPGANNATLFTVHQGLTVEIRAERDEWLQVSLPNGLSGWIERQATGEV